MYKAMIVDDEPAIREGLSSIIDWGDCGFRIVDTAENGREALEKFGEHRPELVIVDIRMPGMSGLEVIQSIRQMNGEPFHFLILSGYADFNYARQAMGFGVDGYLLKPVDEEEMTLELKRVRQSIENEKGDGKWGSPSPHERDWIEALLFPVHAVHPRDAVEPSHRASKQADHQSGAGKHGQQPALPALDWSSYQVILLDLRIPDWDRQARQLAAKQRLAELCRDQDRGIVFEAGIYTGLLLPAMLKTEQDAVQLLAAWRQELKPWVNEIYGAAGAPVDILSDIPRSFEQALRLLERTFLFRAERVMLPEDLHEWETVHAEMDEASDRASDDPMRYAEKLYYALDMANGKAATRVIKDMEIQFPQIYRTESAIKAAFAQTFTLALNKYAAGQEHSRTVLEEHSNLITNVYAYSTLGELVDHSLEHVLQWIGQTDTGGKEIIMKQMIDFIHGHYDENLRLELLADMFNYNSGYLGKLFKSHTGEAFNAYLDKVRIERARELLAQGIKVHRVAGRVGYANADYFHSKFKKYVGMSPSSYRNQTQKNGGTDGC
ncbi:response regulator transcription factor [Paenibacillus polymyxa]|uniref:Chemotaxis protein CheY n=1 Tax=Paenibacillus polymyxa (strain SC2) TaxID=886882 RepID=E3EAD4_PAEPS|nr:response regulator transcription factor [Paenibacillus polymyxa]ADO58552.1 chemotaxis protein CheY [Paenibacillus polymyxa SC2]WPQ56193.1 response regulator transcription factor [Paenibacillus polymyxa]CCI71110.1 Chemotaxis response regulator protein-glutamate methylesterase of group 1 operon [Paenibacillus polymyxa M1]